MFTMIKIFFMFVKKEISDAIKEHRGIMNGTIKIEYPKLVRKTTISSANQHMYAGKNVKIQTGRCESRR